MSYKSQLQTNNNTIVGNNTDLQSILNTINNLPAAGGETINLDAEIAAQDTVISQIQEALANKTSNNGGTSVDTCTVEFSGDNYTYQLTTIDNGVVTLINGAPGYGSSSTVYNVLCNSIAIIEPIFTQMNSITVDGSYNGVWCNYEYGTITIPNKSGQTVVVNVETT